MKSFLCVCESWVTLMTILWLFEPSNNSHFEMSAMPGEKAVDLSVLGFLFLNFISSPFPWWSTIWRCSMSALQRGTRKAEPGAQSEQRAESKGPVGSSLHHSKLKHIIWEMLIQQAGYNNNQGSMLYTKWDPPSQRTRLSPKRNPPRTASEEIYFEWLSKRRKKWV